MSLKRIFALLWALPGTAMGLALSPFYERRRTRQGVLLCEGASWPRRLGFRYTATTLGHVVLSTTSPIPDGVMAHELVHVRQWERWGPVFIAAYPLASVWAWARGGRGYWDNVFERQARALSGQTD